MGCRFFLGVFFFSFLLKNMHMEGMNAICRSRHFKNELGFVCRWDNPPRFTYTNDGDEPHLYYRETGTTLGEKWDSFFFFCETPKLPARKIKVCCCRGLVYVERSFHRERQKEAQPEHIPTMPWEDEEEKEEYQY